MTKSDTYRASSRRGGLEDAVASISGPVARRLTARYVPVYAAVAVMLLVAAVAPSRVDKGSQSSASDFLTSSELATSGGNTSADDRAGVGTPTSSAAPPVVTAPNDNASNIPMPEPAAVTAPVASPSPDGETGGGFAEGDPGGFSDDGDGEQGGDNGGFTDGESACPVEFGEDPEVSRGVAGVLLSAASPALSLLGPLGPNAVPALGLASPILPVVAPVADKFSPYIRVMNPLFLQVSQLGTTLWAGPLQPLEGPLLQLNGAVIQPLEVELLAATAGPIEQLNATPLTPCLQRLVYNLVAPLPTPTP